jgi:sugar lactone lactonase YvrE
MPSSLARPTLASVEPLRAVEGGRIVLHGSGFPVEHGLPEIRLGNAVARVAFASSRRLVIVVPSDLEGGRTPVRIDEVPGETAFVAIGAVWATGLHQVDNPVFDREGNLYVTYSGSRGQEAPVSIFRVTRQGTREPFASGIVNATSMTIGPDGDLYVSSRFEGSVHRVRADGSHEVIASDLGVACGLAFDQDGSLYVGDRSGTIFRVKDSKASPFATLPSSVAAFHLAMSPHGELFIAAPTLGSYDHVYRLDRRGEVSTLPVSFGRPQGLAFNNDGVLHVVDALAGSSGVHRVTGPRFESAELLLSGGALIGVAFGPNGELAVVSNETAYRFE